MLDALRFARLPALLALVFQLGAADAAAQGSAEDYERAAGLRARFAGLRTGGEVRPQWLTSTELWFEAVAADGDFEVVVVDVDAAPDQRRRAIVSGSALRRALGVDARPNVARLARDGTDWRLLVQVPGRADLCGVRIGPDHSIETEDPVDEARFHLRAEDPDGGDVDRGRQETAILFVNESDEVTTLFWVDSSGEWVGYGDLRPGGRRWQHTFVGHRWVLANGSREVSVRFTGHPNPGIASTEPRSGGSAEGATDSRGRRDRSAPGGLRPSPRSPDGRFVLEFDSGNVGIRDETEGTKSRLTSDAGGSVGYARQGFWSADGRSLVVLRRDRPETPVATVVRARGDSGVLPLVESFPYARPGDPILTESPRLFVHDDVGWTERQIDAEAFAEPWRLDQLGFDPGRCRFFVRYNQRGHRVLRMSSIDGRTGEVLTLVEDAPETFVDYNQKGFCRWLRSEDGGLDELLWMSERSGWNHLYLVDARDGGFGDIRPITTGEWPVFDVVEVDDEDRTILFTAGGMLPDQDPYHVHYGRVSIDTGEITWLTDGDGTHRIEFSPDRSHYVDRYSRVDLPTVTELRRTRDGALLTELGRGDDSALREAGWRPPQRFVAKGRDGETDIWGIVHRPTNFDPDRRYPVIENIYAGPHGQHVPKDFRVHRQQAELAELGFVVVQIDGMGTNRRSKAFHDVCWKNLGDAGFPDRIAWMRALSETDPSLDLGRVGIYGGSAGGQNAMRALIAHNDFYRAAVADCGCHDNRVDKIWWNELWMSWPIGPHYDESSNVVQAHRLEGDLLLTVGGVDRNVDPASTFQVVDALIAADKDFELLVFPGSGHGAGESDYGVRRRRDFFVRKLLGVEPRRR